MKTLTIQIGNSDNKLTQSQWSNFCDAIDSLVTACAFHVHFKGFSPGDAPWQNACWVVVVDNDKLQADLLPKLSRLSFRFLQDSIAVTIGETVFVGS